MTPATLLRLALAGSRVDTLRVLLTGFSAALATVVFLAAATVLAIPDAGTGGVSPQYRNPLLAEAGLRPGVVFALLMLTIPVLALAGQCARLGAPARDRRLAAIRLAGATPGQAVAVASAETGAAGLLGSLLGLGAYLAGRELLHRPDRAGQLALPTDVLPSPPVLALVVVGVPALATVVAALLLRSVAITPFGVVRRTRRRAPGPWPGLLIVVGFLLVSLLAPAGRWLDERGTVVPPEVFAIVLFLAALAASLGVVLGTGWLSHTAGRLLHRVARRPAALLAARRLAADPWTGSRTFAALLACVLFGAAAAGIRAQFAAEFAVQDEAARWSARADGISYVPTDNEFYFRALDLVDLAVTVALVIAAGGLLVAVAEGVVSRRRAYASLVATGVPRGTLARALVWQSLAPVVPAVLIALTVGVSLSRGYGGSTVVTAGGTESLRCAGTEAQCADQNSPLWQTVREPLFERRVPVPLDDLAVLGGVTLATLLVVVGIGVLCLRTSTAVEELRVG